MPISEAGASVLGAGIAATGAIGGGIASNAMNAGQTRRQRRWQEEQATIAYNRNIEAWKMNNSYNSPEAQMQRLKKAGINPNMIADSPISAAQAPQAQQASGNPNIPYSNPFDLSGLSSVITALATAIKGNSEIAEIQERILSYKPQRDQILTNIDQMKAQIAKLDEEKKGIYIDNLIKEQTAPDVIQKIQDEAKITHEQAQICGEYLQLVLAGKILENDNLEKSGKFIDAQKRYYDQMSAQSREYTKQIIEMTKTLGNNNWSQTLGEQLQNEGSYGWNKDEKFGTNLENNAKQFLGDSFQVIEYFIGKAGNLLGGLFK